MGQDDLVLQSLLGAGTRYEGKLFFDGRVRIDGDFDGEVRSEGLLVVGDQAVVRGEIHVGTLIVRGGIIEGDVHASELVELHAPARVRGDIHTPALFLDRGAQFDGACVMGEVHQLGPESAPARPSEVGADAPASSHQMDQPKRSWKVMA
jgi:cytoskeletal protein CcmA (bactofilin family)